MDVDWQQLEYFRVAGRLRHVTRAAEQLGITQPALSRALGRLERELGVPLFRRTGRSTELTRYGEAFLGRVERALRELDEGRRELADLAGRERGMILLGFPRTLGAGYAPDLVRRFRAGSPGVRFTLVQNIASELERRLAAGEIDLLLSWPPRRPEIAWHEVGEQELLLAVPSGHRLAERRTIRLAEAADEDFVAFEPGNSIRRLSDELCLAAGFTPRIAFEASDSGSVRGFVAAGFGVALVPAIGFETGVRLLHVGAPAARRAIGIAWMQDRYLSGAERAFRDFVLEQAAQRSASATNDGS